MEARFEGKVVLVTGAASGIGKATAERFAREGAKTVVSDVQEEAGEAVALGIREAGGDARFVRCDVSQPDQVEAMVARTVEAYGRLDCAVNNAGIEGVLAPTAEYPPDVWRRVIDVNLIGVWLCLRAEIPRLLAGRDDTDRAIVNVSSILGQVAFANASAYTASKHGVIGLTKTAALEYAEQGLRVNAVCPAFIETPMVMERGVAAGKDPAVYARIAGLHPVKRLGRSPEVASAILWLCSEDASFVTGHALLADGVIVLTA